MDQVNMNTLLLGGVVLILSLIWWLCTRRLPGIPPSPGVALPILGHLYLMEKDPRAKLHRWRQQYGDIFSLYMGSKLLIVFCGYSVIKEAFVKMADVFSDRGHLFMADRISKNKGIVMAEGRSWKEQRKTSLEILRELGMGKNMLAEKIQEEVSHFVKAIEDHGGKPVDLHRLITVSVSNNICSIVFGKRFNYDDQVFIRYLENVEDNMKRLGGASIINFLPVLEHLPGDLFGMHRILANVKDVENNFLQPAIDNHMHSYTQHEEATDFIYAYLRQMKKREEQDTLTSLCETELLKTIGDLFVAGSETTSVTISWTLLYFLHHPDVQEKCYSEVCEVIGTERQPSIRDRAKMVYLEATIQEILRIVDIAAFSAPHATTHDVTFRGYIIPKDAIIMPFLDTILHDSQIWGDPENFRPERFIDADSKLIRPDEFTPFGLGRRACLGEALARMELFLYLCTLIQHFQFLPPEPDTLPSIVGHLGGTHSPSPYKIRAVRRE